MCVDSLVRLHRQLSEEQLMTEMSSPTARDSAVKKKHVRFASMEDDEDNDEQEEDTLFDKRKDSGRAGLKSVLKAAKRTAKSGCDERVEVVGGGRGGQGACGRWTVTLALCASFLGLVNEGGDGRALARTSQKVQAGQ